jgi:hypothetical protein
MRLRRLRAHAAEAKDRLVRILLVVLIALGVAAQVFKPLGDALSAKGFLGGSFAAFIALIIFDAITGTDASPPVDGVRPLSDVSELGRVVEDAFRAKHIKIDFVGFTMQTLIDMLGAPMRKLANNPSGAKSLTLRIVLPDLDSVMSFPCRVDPVPGTEGTANERDRFSDSPENRRRMKERFQDENWVTLRKNLRDIDAKLSSGIAVSCEIRKSPLSPEFKLFIINDEYAYFGYYSISINEDDVPGQKILDPQAFGGARLIGWSRRAEAATTREIADYHAGWFENLWNRLARTGSEPATNAPGGILVSPRRAGP